MGKTGEARSNKRRFGSGKGAPHRTPRRGPPAIFVTCESGRERKCQREALDLIHHYYYLSKPKTEKEVPSEKASLSKKVTVIDDAPLDLEEELALLRKGAAAEEVLSFEPNLKRPRPTSENGNVSSKDVSSMKSPFSIYDVGVRGVVCIVCTLPGCEMVPYDDILANIRAKKEENEGDDATTKTKSDENTIVKKHSKTDKRSDPSGTKLPLWDAVETVRCILSGATCSKRPGKDTDPDSTDNDIGQQTGGQKEVIVIEKRMTSPPPGSRFISRILPMQATCYASVEEIQAVSTVLLKRLVPTFPAILSKEVKELTFAVDIKRRLCSHLKRDEVISAITSVVYGGLEELPGHTFSVNLSDPDFSIRIETVKSLCGISILPREAWYKNFNMAELANPSSESK